MSRCIRTRIRRTCRRPTSPSSSLVRVPTMPTASQALLVRLGNGPAPSNFDERVWPEPGRTKLRCQLAEEAGLMAKHDIQLKSADFESDIQLAFGGLHVLSDPVANNVPLKRYLTQLHSTFKSEKIASGTDTSGVLSVLLYYLLVLIDLQALVEELGDSTTEYKVMRKTQLAKDLSDLTPADPSWSRAVDVVNVKSGPSYALTVNTVDKSALVLEASSVEDLESIALLSYLCSGLSLCFKTDRLPDNAQMPARARGAPAIHASQAVPVPKVASFVAMFMTKGYPQSGEASPANLSEAISGW
eukprot:4420019-Amphidinium_carterae.1